MMISKSFSRVSGRRLSSTFQRRLHITCRGKPISHEEVFQYSNGHFLVDEEYNYSRRYKRFNIDELCNLVGAIIGKGASTAPRVVKMEKLEGGFHKVLLMTLENGSEVVAKIPCPNAGLSMLSTASEAAVLEFVRTHTTTPAPKVLAWSSDAKNPVGAEYIILEKAKGVQLTKVWGGLSEARRLDVIKGLVLIEKQLLSLQFPAYGNLYFRRSIPNLPHVPLDKDIDPSGQYCIGPAASLEWADGNETLEYNSGPWMNLQEFGECLAKRSLRKGFPTVRAAGCQPPSYGTPTSHKLVLESAINTVPTVSNHPSLIKTSMPALLHTDLNMGNIFTAEENTNTINITSIIDWHSLSIAPRFLQARWPVFLEPLDGYIPGLIAKPEPLSGLEEMDAADRAVAKLTYEQSYLAKAYEVCTGAFNAPLHNALLVPPALKEIYIRCGETHVDGNFPLRSCLAELYKYWSDLRFTESCPIQMTETELSEYHEELARYEEWNDLQVLVKRALDTDSEGWISPVFDWDEKRKQHQELYQLFANKMLAENKTIEEIKQMWPFAINS
ncbi:phosphotransferase enzyme family protein [Nannizzia gypsea CBS 118893]|uniref:Altered inheritance of mitochondria protein 9, mitochondrial n=1 Tax=Arthroderma gypseum (strain ATCC MYA-4604 / CBS 118893) TaxID=535722 RepID=E5R2V2_ARTGP|nr:phosphotransferase enzyme family protein [Nannizzia gypsea CBS 118893]EFQ97873.1 phosphotransferase enzyme family protein [Nannizzia gypsea CBS 118893]